MQQNLETELPFILGVHPQVVLKDVTDAQWEVLREEERGTFLVTEVTTEDNRKHIVLWCSDGECKPPRSIKFQIDATNLAIKLSSMWEFATFEALCDFFRRTAKLDLRPIDKVQFELKVRRLPSEPLPVFRSLISKISQDIEPFIFRKGESIEALKLASSRLRFAFNLQDDKTKKIIFAMLNTVLKHESPGAETISSYDDLDFSKQMIKLKPELNNLYPGIDDQAADKIMGKLADLFTHFNFEEYEYDPFHEKVAEISKTLFPDCDLEEARRFFVRAACIRQTCDLLKKRLPNTIEFLIEQNQPEPDVGMDDAADYRPRMS